MLSVDQLAAYHRDGFLAVQDFATPDACRALRDRASEIVEAFEPSVERTVFTTDEQERTANQEFFDSASGTWCFFEEGAVAPDGELIRPKVLAINKIGHAMHDLDPVFGRFSRMAKLGATVASLGFVKPGIIQSMYIFKPPRIGGEVVCHQDSTYIYTEPESCVGFWFALEDATLENGCMQFIPGAHRGPLKARNHRTANGSLVTDILDHEPWPEALKLPAEARAGTLVIFQGRAPHMSAPNRSAHSRHAYTLHVIDQASHYPADNWLQRSPDLPIRGFN
jgi:phytanoyl-CoA hydroxylase